MIRVNLFTRRVFSIKMSERKRKLEFGTLFYFLTGFRVESDSKIFKGNCILGPDYPSLTGFRVESD